MQKLAIYLLALILPVCCSALGQSLPVQRPAWKPGDTWTYSLHYKLAGRPSSSYVVTITSVDGNGRSQANYSNPRLSEAGTLLLDADDNLIEYKKDSGIIQYHANPSYPGYQWPLSVGRSWHRDFDYTAQGEGRHYKANLTAHVVGLEKITVPAGTFDTLKIERRLDYQGFNGTNSWAGTVNSVTWYSAQSKSFVRSESTDLGTYGPADTAIRELAAYRVQ
ncbi:MAG TPA: hypothetical protein VFW46_09380 [Stellaceae bacterium]|nr:hypothetical protein [Stellaceae bacterium]